MTTPVVPCAVQRDSGAPQTRNPEGVNRSVWIPRGVNRSLGVPALRCATAGTTGAGSFAESMPTRLSSPPPDPAFRRPERGDDSGLHSRLSSRHTFSFPRPLPARVMMRPSHSPPGIPLIPVGPSVLRFAAQAVDLHDYFRCRPRGTHAFIPRATGSIATLKPTNIASLGGSAEIGDCGGILWRGLSCVSTVSVRFS